MHVKLAPVFKRKLIHLPQDVQEKVFQALRAFKLDPSRSDLNNHALRKPPYLGSCSINITDDYRALYKKYSNTAHFHNLGTHAELYSK